MGNKAQADNQKLRQRLLRDQGNMCALCSTLLPPYARLFYDQDHAVVTCQRCQLGTAHCRAMLRNGVPLITLMEWLQSDET